MGVNEPVLIVRPDDGPIGPKYVALYVLLMVIIYVLDENILCLTFKNRASYIQDGRTATLQMLHFISFFFQQL